MIPNPLAERITVQPGILGGKATIRGLRISVEQILRALGNGVPEEDLLADYPELTQEDFRAAQLYAAERLVEERLFPIAAA